MRKKKKKNFVWQRRNKQMLAADTTKMYRTSYDKLIINHMVKNAFGRGETSKGCTKIFTINLWFNKFKEINKIK